ncbi:MAG: hypothetical protein ABWZ56_08470 [Flavobacterium sp.]
MKTILLLATIMFLSQSCTKQDIEMEQKTAFATANKISEGDFPGEITYVSFQSWFSGIRGGGFGTDFYIELAQPLPEGVGLSQLYFRNKKAPVTFINKTHYEAKFLNNENTDNEEILQSKFNNETIANAIQSLPVDNPQAVLVYYEDNVLKLHLLTNLKELPPLLYP